MFTFSVLKPIYILNFIISQFGLLGLLPDLEAISAIQGAIIGGIFSATLGIGAAAIRAYVTNKKNKSESQLAKDQGFQGMTAMFVKQNQDALKECNKDKDRAEDRLAETQMELLLLKQQVGLDERIVNHLVIQISAISHRINDIEVITSMIKTGELPWEEASEDIVDRVAQLKTNVSRLQASSDGLHFTPKKRQERWEGEQNIADSPSPSP